MPPIPQSTVLVRCLPRAGADRSRTARVLLEKRHFSKKGTFAENRDGIPLLVQHFHLTLHGTSCRMLDTLRSCRLSNVHSRCVVVWGLCSVDRYGVQDSTLPTLTASQTMQCQTRPSLPYAVEEKHLVALVATVDNVVAGRIDPRLEPIRKLVEEVSLATVKQGNLFAMTEVENSESGQTLAV